MRKSIHVLSTRKKYSLLAFLLGLVVSFNIAVNPSYGQQTGAEFTTSDVPHVISYQGMLTNTAGEPVPDGKYPVNLRLYSDEQGSNYVWEDKYTVDVKGGVFSVQLGSGSSHLPRLISIDQPLWVGVTVGNQAEMKPLTALTSVPYALNVADNSITAKKMATDFVGGITVDNTPLSLKGQSLDLRSGNGKLEVGRIVIVLRRLLN